MSRTIEIVGAGPAGLSAALTVARAGGRAVVDERSDVVGKRFHGDFEGIENWTTEGDVLDELAGMGVEPTFDYAPFREMTIFDPHGEAHACASDKPLWYLIRRGPQAGTLDRSLQEQAEAAGVRIRFGTAQDHLPEGGIVAHGPRRADAIDTDGIAHYNRMHHKVLDRGCYIPPSGYEVCFVSAAHTEEMLTEAATTLTEIISEEAHQWS